jgi:tetratricopeptide (TPR) repeat protein
MIGLRWPAVVLLAPLVAIGGCGGSKTSAGKAYDHFVAAASALEAGDKEKAFAELSASIEKSPNAWSYFQRARLYAEQGRDEEAIADCQKGLELAPNDRNLLWLAAELKKPAAQRFKGPFAKPPVGK